MVRFSCLAVLLLAVVRSHAKEAGPPIDEHPDLCTHMTPSATAVTGHGAMPRPVNSSPFQIKTSRNCYKAGQRIRGTVQVKPTKANVIEGIFLQARRVDSGEVNKAVGTMDNLGIAKTQLLTCHGTANSALAHKGEPKTLNISFIWTPPPGETGNFQFRVTVLEHKDTFWVGVLSDKIMHDVNCVESRVIPETPEAIPTNMAAGHVITSVLGAVVGALFLYRYLL